MRRKWWILIIAAALLGVAAYVVFSGTLLRWGVHAVENWVTKKTPYDLKIGAAHLQLTRGLVLQSLALQEKGSSEPLLRVNEIQLRVDLKSLWNRQIVVNKIVVSEPRVTLMLPLPERPSETPAAHSSQSLFKEIKNFEIDDGHLLILNNDQRIELSSVSIDGSMLGNQLEAASYSVALGDQAISGDAHIRISSVPAYDVGFVTTRLNVPVVARQFTSFPENIRFRYSGKGRVVGTPERWRVTSEGTAAGGSIWLQWNHSPTGQFVQTRFKKITLSQFVVHSGIGPSTFISGDLRAQTSDDWISRAKVVGKLQLEGLVTRTEQTNIALEGQLNLEKGRGNTAFSMKGDAVDGHIQGTFVTRTGSIDANFNVSSPQIATLRSLYSPLGDWQGAISSSGTLRGYWKNPLAQITLNTANIQNQTLKLDSLAMSVQSVVTSTSHFLVEASAKGVQWDKHIAHPWDLDQAHVKWNGSLDQGQIDAHGWLRDKTQIDGAGELRHSNDEWKWIWSKFVYVFKDSETWTADPGGSLAYSEQDGFTALNTRVTKENGALNLHELHINGDRFKWDIDARQFPLHVTMPVSSRTVTVNGYVDGRINVDGLFASPTGKFKLVFSSGAVNDISVREFLVQGTAEKSMLHVEHGRLLTSYVDDPALFHGDVPWHWVVESAPDLPMNVALSFGPVDPANWLKKIPNTTVDNGGSAKFKGRVFGRRKKIAIEGSLQVAVPRIKLKDYGIDLQNVVIDIQNENQVFRIAKGSAQMGKKGTFSISGESHLPNLQVILAGRDIQFKIPRRLDFLGDANLQLGGTMDRPDLSGKLSVRRGTYEVPPKKKEGPPAPRTAADEFEESFWQNMHLNVAAQWPGNVWYRDGLSKIESQADIRVMKESGTKQIYLSGVLTLVRGSYNVYGRDFVIKSGELTFRGPPDIDPNIQIEAEYKTDEVTVELQVSGTASQPKLTLTSTPPMTQPEILSYLATGISSVRGSELNKSGGSPVSGGSTLAAGVLSSYLTNEVRASGLNVLQLDVLRVTPTANGNVWTVGRYLGPKFFFSYSTNSKDTANKVVNGEYMLSPRWSLVGQTGSNTDDYLDIQFRVPWVRKEKKKPEPDKK